MWGAPTLCCPAIARVGALAVELSSGGGVGRAARLVPATLHAVWLPALLQPAHKQVSKGVNESRGWGAAAGDIGARGCRRL